MAVLTGKFDNRRGYYQIVCDSAKVLSIETMISNAKNTKLYDPDEPFDLSARKIDDIISENEPPEKEKKTAPLFTIEVPKEADNAKMKDLNDLLLRHKGETPVSISIPSADKKIKLPFGINLTSELRKSVDSLLK